MSPALERPFCTRCSSRQEQFRRATLTEDLGGGSALEALVIEAIKEGLRTRRERRQRIAEDRASCCSSSSTDDGPSTTQKPPAPAYWNIWATP
jgi:hypothetical protein